jgi:hypothetical protein
MHEHQSQCGMKNGSERTWNNLQYTFTGLVSQNQHLNLSRGGMSEQ